jgi:hypothetical protein
MGSELGDNMFAREILENELEPELAMKLDRLINDCTYVTTLLIGIENWFRINGDEKGARILEQAASKMSQHEAETL